MSFLQERESHIITIRADCKCFLHKNVCWKELLSQTKHHVVINKKLTKFNNKIMYHVKPLHYDLLLPYFLLCDNQLESRTTPFQERGDDEVILTMDTTPSIDRQIASGDKQMHDHMHHNFKVSCLGSRTPGVKDTPFLGSARGAKEAGRRQLSGEISDLRTSK